MVHAPDAGRLPAEVSTFIGRRDELVRVRDAVGAARLTTLVGPGGVGKTRLALRALATVTRGFPAGVHVVELGRLTAPGQVGTAVTEAFGLRGRRAAAPADAIAAVVGARHALVVLDGCEHVLDAAARLVAGLLLAAPGVRVLATSREPLAVTGEHVLPVLPLPLPAADDDGPLARLREHDAIALFVERAAAAGTFELTAANRHAVVEVCLRLDGLPLAIELAAARTQALSPEQILERLDDRFTLLAGGRRDAPPHQRTLRATLEWSHDLLDPAEQELLATVSTFAGRFTLEDVEAVGRDERQDAGSAHVATTFAGLVAKSLVARHEASGVASFRLHESVREFGRLRLRESGRAADVEQRLLAHYLTAAGRFAVQGRHRLVEVLPWAELEVDNLRAVLRRALDDAPDAGLTLATSLVWFWVTRATTEGAAVLDELLARVDGTAWALFVRGFLAVQQGDPDVAVPVLARGVAAARAVDDPVALTQTLAMGSIAASLAGEAASSAGLLAQAHDVAARTDDVGARLMLLQAGAQTALAAGDLSAARAAAARGVELSREVGDLYSLGMMLLNEGFAALLDGEVAAARKRFDEGLGVARRIDDRVAQCYLVGGLGACASALGDHARAATLLGAMEGMRALVGGNAHAAMAPALARAGAASTRALGDHRAEVAARAGRALTREAAVRLALREPPPAEPDVVPGPSLAPREREVAHLVADGMTNKEIGARLFISERTVESHVRSILGKLGFRSRAQIVRWVAQA